MNYIRSEANGQLTFAETTESLMIPSTLYGFHNASTETVTAASGRNIFVLHGAVDLSDDERRCDCGCRMHINNSPEVNLRHLPFGSTLTCVVYPHIQLRCNKCGATKSQFIAFKAEGHRITQELFNYVYDLLATGTYTNKEIASLVGLHQAVIKSIDKQRLLENTPLTVSNFESQKSRLNISVSMNLNFMMDINLPRTLLTLKPVMFSLLPKGRRSALSITLSNSLVKSG